MRAIYFVLESKRVDQSFEKLENVRGLRSVHKGVRGNGSACAPLKQIDSLKLWDWDSPLFQECPPCPALPEEEKFKVGVENKASKMYKKKCVGRSRKQNADYAMLTGLPQLALDSYAAAMEALKSSNDMLWYAGLFIIKCECCNGILPAPKIIFFTGSCEGWACAAMSLLYDGLSSCTSMYRVASMTPAQMRDISIPSLGAAVGAASQHSLGVSLGHQRHRSDENARVPVIDDGSDGSESRRSTGRIPWAAVLRGERPKDKIEPAAILEKFEQALENYSKFSFAAMIEYDCMMKAVSLYRYQRLYVEMEVRLSYTSLVLF
ncbi:hypothetical protein TELCIR_06226 [Teladorsagia circumcincta]|uniref:Uncharacterized protein n=1 Tax=Teladorsagia circumcincta TaxID=45464 RepID=A0A2G9UNS0_TELCI|nr:hypothetical protein TELCIR_06226 [Teladorsagia circumcincta]